MKHLLLIALLLPMFTFSQGDVPTKDGKVVYEFIDSSVAASKDALYIRAKVWFTNNFKNAKSVIQTDDKEAGLIIGKGFTRFKTGSGLFGEYINNIAFTIDITVKENKYRVRVYDIQQDFETSGHTAPVEKRYERYQQGKDKKDNGEFFTALTTKTQDVFSTIKKQMAETTADF